MVTTDDLTEVAKIIRREFWYKEAPDEEVMNKVSNLALDASGVCTLDYVYGGKTYRVRVESSYVSVKERVI